MEITDKKLLGLLGLARRAGKLDLGADAAAQAVRRHHAKLLLLARDLSVRTAEKMQAEAQSAGVRCRQSAEDMDALEKALGKRTGVIAVNDAGFAEAMLALCAEERGGIIL